MVEATNEFIVELLRRIRADVSNLKLDVREIAIVSDTSKSKSRTSRHV